jgi:hypothetical protein
MKGKMCRYIKSDGVCPRGEECWFAHSKADLVPERVSFGRHKNPPVIMTHDSIMDISE